MWGWGFNLGLHALAHACPESVLDVCRGEEALSLVMRLLSLCFLQSSSNSCSVLEATKHQDLNLPRAFSFCYQQEIESTKQTLGSRSKALPEQVWIKVGGK